jgi:hypothetical protein
MLSNEDLEHLCTYYRVPLCGVHLRDELPRGGPRPGLTIVNLDDSKLNFPFGTHWCCLWNAGKECVYFDSFGALPPPEVIAWSKMKSAGGLRYNAWICQSLKSETCGWFCLAFGLFMHRELKRGESIADCSNRYVNLYEDDTSKNDKHLFAYLNKKAPIPKHYL